MAQVYRFTDENGQTRLMAEIDPSPGGGPATGTYLPVADATGVTVDTTTYDDVLAGSGKMTTLVFPGIQGALAIAVAGDAFPRLVLGSRPSDGLYMSDGTVEPTQNGANIRGGGTSNLTLDASGSTGTLALFGAAQVDAPTTSFSPPRMSSVSPRFTITSGALPTVQLVTATGAQILTTRDAETVTPFTGDGTNNAATCAIAISPDDMTYSTVATISIAAALNLTGVLTDTVNARVPAGWYLKLTVSHGTLGLTTYY